MNAHSKFAGRVPAGKEQPIVVKKDGVKHSRHLPTGEEEEVMSIGLACSECFSGERLGLILQEGFEYERKVMQDLLCGKPASPLSNHTSGGVTGPLSELIQELEPHLPWKDLDTLDWCLSLQLEGSSAVWAAVDMLIQKRSLTSREGLESSERLYVAVGECSYHGPPSTSFGAKSPIWKKEYQLRYPVPIAGLPFDEQEFLASFDAFLEEEGWRIGVMMFEPQWGSSQAAFPWPPRILKECIMRAKSKGIYIVCDEIMCGLGRHGHGTIFVSKALDLDPDAITFGKAMGAGVFPISGAILKEGKNELQKNGLTVMQSHTYAGASVRALMTAVAVIRQVPKWFPHISSLEQEMSRICKRVVFSSKGMTTMHGQGLMWGGIFSKSGKMEDPETRSCALALFRARCTSLCILPYFVPAGGFMITPLYDVDVETIKLVGEKLEQALLYTANEIGWYDGFVKNGVGQNLRLVGFDSLAESNAVASLT